MSTIANFDGFVGCKLCNPTFLYR